MTTSVKSIPQGYHSVTPYLMIKGATQAIEFYKKAFGAKERMRMTAPNGKIMHAELTMGDSVIMLADECPEMNALGPQSVGGSPVTIHLYVDDVDAVFNRAIAAGAESIRPVANQFYGDRTGYLSDPFGHKWGLATHVEEVSEEEIYKRAEKMMAEGQHK